MIRTVLGFLFNPRQKVETKHENLPQTEPTQSTEPQPLPIFDALLKEHLGLLVSAALVTFAVVKIIIFARGDLSLALAVLNTGQQFTILASTMFNALVIMAMLFVSLPTITLGQRPAPVDKPGLIRHYMLRYFPLLMAWGLLVIAAPIFYLATAALFAALDVIIYLRRKKKKRLNSGNGQRRRGRKAAIFLLSANMVILVIVLASTEWSPRENISIGDKSAESSTSGYLLGQQGKHFLLVASDRSSVRWIHEDSITSRSLCSSDVETEWYSKSALRAFTSLKPDIKPAPCV